MKESKLPDDQKKAALAQVRTDHTRQAHDELLAMHLASVEDAELSQEQRDQLAIHQSAGISQTMALQMIATAEEQANTDAQDVVQDSTPAINMEDTSRDLPPGFTGSLLNTDGMRSRLTDGSLSRN